MTKKKLPFIKEGYPDNYTGYPFLSLVQTQDKQYITIINNHDNKELEAYVLDFCGPNRIKETSIVTLAEDWWYNGRNRYPISVEFSRIGICGTTSKIFRTFNIDNVRRVIGFIPHYPMTPTEKIHRRQIKKSWYAHEKKITPKQDKVYKFT